MNDKSDKAIQSIFFFYILLILNKKTTLALGLNVCQGANYLAEASSLDLDATVHSQKEAARGSMWVTGRKKEAALCA